MYNLYNFGWGGEQSRNISRGAVAEQFFEYGVGILKVVYSAQYSGEMHSSYHLMIYPLLIGDGVSALGESFAHYSGASESFEFHVV